MVDAVLVGQMQQGVCEQELMLMTVRVICVGSGTGCTVDTPVRRTHAAGEMAMHPPQHQFHNRNTSLRYTPHSMCAADCGQIGSCIRAPAPTRCVRASLTRPRRSIHGKYRVAPRTWLQSLLPGLFGQPVPQHVREAPVVRAARLSDFRTLPRCLPERCRLGRWRGSECLAHGSCSFCRAGVACAAGT